MWFDHHFEVINDLHLCNNSNQSLLEIWTTVIPCANRMLFQLEIYKLTFVFGWLLFLKPSMNICFEKSSPLFWIRSPKNMNNGSRHTHWITVENSFFIWTDVSLTPLLITDRKSFTATAPSKSLHCKTTTFFINRSLYKPLHAGWTSSPRCRCPHQGMSTRSCSLFLFR